MFLDLAYLAVGVAVVPRRAGGSSRRAIACRDIMDYIIAGVAAVLLFVYLVYALLRPERF